MIDNLSQNTLKFIHIYSIIFQLSSNILQPIFISFCHY